MFKDNLKQQDIQKYLNLHAIDGKEKIFPEPFHLYT